MYAERSGKPLDWPGLGACCESLSERPPMFSWSAIFASGGCVGDDRVVGCYRSLLVSLKLTFVKGVNRGR